jgi:hypothetical protein
MTRDDEFRRLDHEPDQANPPPPWARKAVLFAVLVFIVVLGFLTIVAAIDGGPDILTVLSTLILALFGFGVVGALREPPE